LKLLHTDFSERFLVPLGRRLVSLDPPVELAALGSAQSPALVVPAALVVDELAAATAAGVRWIQAVTAGVENVLIPELVDSDIVVTSSGGASAGPMAEFVFARILEHAKRLRRLAAQEAAHLWKASWSAELAGATMTVVGLGPIGTRVAELGKAFGMRVIGVRRRPEAGPGPCDEVVGTASLRDAMSRADFVVLAPALTASTRWLIGMPELAAMRDGALLINVGRGDLIEEHVLLEATRAGRVVAALDVVGEEPLPAESPLWEAESISISPHCSALTPPLLDRLAGVVAENVRRFVANEPLLNIVDKTAGYPSADTVAP
jgi:phosphoglycerate dehydrogenase-like enzyme